MTKEILEKAIWKSFEHLATKDGMLFEMPIAENAPYDDRKLHEVCINHKLAEYLAFEIIPKIEGPMFADIEFNREGINFKEVQFEGETFLVRPDVIIHNRKSGEEKRNLLVVECKKIDAPTFFIEEDKKKILAMMTDAKYLYQYGLQVFYGSKAITGHLFFRQDDKILTQPINYP